MTGARPRPSPRDPRRPRASTLALSHRDHVSSLVRLLRPVKTFRAGFSPFFIGVKPGTVARAKCRGAERWPGDGFGRALGGGRRGAGLLLTGQPRKPFLPVSS